MSKKEAVPEHVHIVAIIAQGLVMRPGNLDPNWVACTAVDIAMRIGGEIVRLAAEHKGDHE